LLQLWSVAINMQRVTLVNTNPKRERGSEKDGFRCSFSRLRFGLVSQIYRDVPYPLERISKRPKKGDRHILLRRLRKMSQSPDGFEIRSIHYPIPASPRCLGLPGREIPRRR